MALTVDDIKKWMGSLEQKRDELRLQAHLLGMEARDEFDKVDQSIDKFLGAALPITMRKYFCKIKFLRDKYVS